MTLLRSAPWSYWLLPALVLVGWVAGWWGSRRVRLWASVLVPFAAVGGLCLGLALTDPVCASPQCDVPLGGSPDFTPSTSLDAVVQANSFLALMVALPLTLVTWIVEYVLLVRRQNREGG